MRNIDVILLSILCVWRVCGQDAASKLELAAQIGQEKYSQVEPVTVKLLLRNRDSSDAMIIEPLELKSIRVMSFQGKVMPLTQYGERVIRPVIRSRRRRKVAPNEALSFQINLNRLVDLSLAGKYTVQLEYTFEQGNDSTKTDSLAFEIVDPADEDERPNRIPTETQNNETHTEVPPVTIESKHAIVVGTGAVSFRIGSSPIRVDYKNSDTNEWVLVRPDISMGCIVHIRDKGMLRTHKTQFPNAIYDSTIRSGGMQTIHLVPQQPRTTIKPNDSRSFALDLCTLGYDWKPGEYELWIENTEEKINSNLISFKMEVNADTVGLLLDMASGLSDSKDVLENHHQQMRHDFAVNWLIKTFPDLPLNPITDRDAQNVVDAKYEQNARFIADFREKWKTRKDSPEIKKLFEVLNGAK